MAINEEQSQAAIAAELEETARTLAHSTRTVASPIDSYRMIGDVRDTSDHLAQVSEQLAAWHRRTQDGVHYDGEDNRGDGTGAAQTAAGLDRASAAFRTAADELRGALNANSVIRWFDEPETTEEP
ncbi:hypothetical protein [Leucobacter sp. wl10]|uniref:hypothetical protein n=1 Tax=Leucobacter sp. wl10 TaxID=2304677 RepID=UPI000E5C2FAB|nr:hypothetical protein [Leucobacter sp. wl10]RGE19077.1 hypothetical protein D1J51_13225 [Leucobacter sp. wl10]